MLSQVYVYMSSDVKILCCWLACVFAVTRVPDVPGRPVVDKVDDNEVTIHWTSPDSDGGSKITHYVIHYGTEDMDLESFAKHRVTGRKTSCTISRRICRNKQYKFAVAAENKDGVGPLSEFSECINTPARTGMPFSVLYILNLMIWIYVKPVL